MDMSLNSRDRQQSSERQRLEYGEQSTWEEKKNANENSKNLHRYSWIFDCKAAHKWGVKYMIQSKEWLLRKKKKKP